MSKKLTAIFDMYIFLMLRYTHFAFIFRFHFNSIIRNEDIHLTNIFFYIKVKTTFEFSPVLPTIPIRLLYYFSWDEGKGREYIL